MYDIQGVMHDPKLLQILAKTSKLLFGKQMNWRDLLENSSNSRFDLMSIMYIKHNTGMHSPLPRNRQILFGILSRNLNQANMCYSSHLTESP